MPILFDYRCGTCGFTFEALVDNHEQELPCPTCLHPAPRILSWRGGVLGRNKGKFPYFDTQLGLTLESSQHRDAVAKQRGLEVMGVEEFDRSRHAPKSPDPMDSREPDPELIECAKRAWDDVKFQRVDEAALAKEIASRPDVQADFLDAKKADVNS